MTEYRCEIELTETRYQGDRTERLVLVRVSAEADSEGDALGAAKKILVAARSEAHEIKQEQEEKGRF